MPSVLMLELDAVAVGSTESSALVTILSVRLSCKSALPMTVLSSLVVIAGFAGGAIAAWYVDSAVFASVVLLSFTADATELRKALRGSDVPVLAGERFSIDWRMVWVVSRFPDEIDFSS
jgi:hypothetical protein